MKLKKGDKVKVLIGKDKGREGEIEKLFPKTEKITITGINMYKKHVRPQTRKDQAAGGIIDIVRPLLASKVALICPKCHKQTRVGQQIFSDGKKRICRKCKEAI